MLEERFGALLRLLARRTATWVGGGRMRMAWPAALVHLFTALGAVCALLATRAVLAGAWEQVFAWLGLALIIDGIDGTFARMADVSAKLPRFSGERLDLVIDYVTYVFVPALALLQAGYLRGRFGVMLASLILLSSLFHFSDTESKSEDHCFVGFPAIWNIVAFYVFAFAMPSWAAACSCSVCVVLTFVPMRWAHPLRTPLLWPVTLAADGRCGCVAACLTLWSGFPAGPSAQGDPAARRRLWRRSCPSAQPGARVGAADGSPHGRCDSPGPRTCRALSETDAVLARPRGHRPIGGTRCRLTVPRGQSPRPCGHRQLPHRRADGRGRPHRLVVLSALRFRSRLLAAAGRRRGEGLLRRGAGGRGRLARAAYLRNTAIVADHASATPAGNAVRITDFTPRFKRFERVFNPPQIFRRIEPVAGLPRITIRVRPTFNYGGPCASRAIGSNHIRYSGGADTLRAHHRCRRSPTSRTRRRSR